MKIESLKKKNEFNDCFIKLLLIHNDEFRMFHLFYGKFDTKYG